MAGWLISVPVWGDEYIDVFVKYTAPALRAALKGFRPPFRFLIHTNRPAPVLEALPDFHVEVRQVSPSAPYVTLQQSHQDAVRSAMTGERVALLNADLVVSKNLFKSCEKHIAGGKQAVVLVGIRTVKDPAVPPPIGEESRALLEWAWEHRHQIIRDVEWGSGRSMLPTNIFFTEGENVVMHGFHLHPVAVLKTGDLDFKSTIDGDLLDYIPTQAIHVVTSPDDMSMLELSKPDRRFPLRAQALNPDLVAGAMRSRASLRHCWLFLHRIVVKGNTPDLCNEATIVRQILDRMPNPSFFGRK